MISFRIWQPSAKRIRRVFPRVTPRAIRRINIRGSGLLPWAITENYGKLRSEFSYLKAFEEDGGTPEEIANAQANIIYTMGVMGHHVGDASQPLHTTIHHHGWKGENPHHYSTRESIHGWIDGGYFRKIGGANLKEMQSKLRVAQLVSINGRTAKPEEMFQAVMTFILEQHKQVEPLYQLDQEGKLSGEGELGMQGRAFLEGQLMKSGQMLGDIWYSAWQEAPPDSYLKGLLARRKGANPRHQAPPSDAPRSRELRRNPSVKPQAAVALLISERVWTSSRAHPNP